MSCIICGNENYREIVYNNHLNKKSAKVIVKKLLPYIEWAVPRSFANYKKLAIGRKYFNGKIRICEKCGHGYLVNPPDSERLIKYYKKAYWTHRSDVQSDKYQKNQNFLNDYRAKQQLDILKNNCSISTINSVLEIGAGSAYASLLLKHFKKEEGIDLYVYEPGTQWENYYEENEINKIGDYFPSETNLKFDYIHTSHWLEHTNDLDETIQHIKKLLNSNGKIFVEVPNEEFHYWNLQIEDTPHLQFFTKQSLKLAFEKNGFSSLFLGTYGISYLERSNGLNPNEENSIESPEGFWIRALFEKES